MKLFVKSKMEGFTSFYHTLNNSLIRSIISESHNWDYGVSDENSKSKSLN